ncbi:TrbI/VirB10 family protein (plasmid) [Comamonas aquatica]|nr:TrbI/VirB10 family protein [Comamonas aquatica]
MAKSSVINPIDLEPKSPFNKKIVFVVVVIALLSVGGAAMLGSMATSTATEDEDDTKVINPYAEGTSRSVNNEWEALLKDENKRPPSTSAQQSIPSQVQETQPAPINSDGNGINVPKDDILVQGEISAISIVDENEQSVIENVKNAYVRPAEQKIADLMPKRLSEEEAFIKSAQMSSALLGQNSLAATDKTASSPLAVKTNRFMSTLGGVNDQVLRKNAAPGQWVLTAGKTIPAITRRAQNSDLPCAVEATTSVDVYDSYTSTKLLIPKGSELIGVCSNDIAYGQNRILSAFTRLILPNGQWFDLKGGAGMDRTGATGLKGDVDNHFFRMFASAFMIAFIADRVDGKKTNNNTYIGNSESAKSAAGQVMVDTSEFILDRNKQVQPTIDVEAGTRVYVQVKHDMVFD